MLTRIRVLFLAFFLLGTHAKSQEIRSYMDLQTHPCMHMAYGFFGKGLEYFDPDQTPEIGHRHLFTNVNHANFLEHNSGARILVNGVILPEVLVRRKKARARALAQIEFVNEFVQTHSDRFALAKTPEEVRQLVLNTDKTVVLHSIEGGKRLIDGPEDARFWADQGVAFITLIHLMDDEFGGAAILPELTTRVINLRGVLKKNLFPGKSRGLTEKGKNAIVWLADAGVLTDLTHMSDPSRTDALAVMEEHGIPPLVTHDMFKPLQNHPRGIPAHELVKIYQLGGMVSLPLSGTSTQAHHPEAWVRQRLAEVADDHCPGSIDSYRFTYELVQEYLQERTDTLLGQPGAEFGRLSENEKVDLAIGFQSDFNGWVNHHHPRVGEEGCFELEEGKSYEAIELQGLAHPGLLPSHWNWLRQQDVDLSPIERAPEKFLRMWEQVRSR